MGKLLKQSPDIDWGNGPHEAFSGIHIHKEKDGISIGGWYDQMVGIESIFVSWEELQRWIPRVKRMKRVPRDSSK